MTAVAIWLRRSGIVCSWAVAIAMLLVCGLRLVGWDSDTFEVEMLAVTPWLLLPSVPLLAVGLVSRRLLLLALVAAISLIAEAVWEGPVLWPLRTPPPALAQGRFVIFDANVAQDNYNLTGIAGEIRADHPNVIALEELTPPGLSSLRATGVLDQYGWSLVRAQMGAGGMAVWSDLPASGLTVWSFNTSQVEIDGWIHPEGSAAVRLDVVHVFAPVGMAEPREWVESLQQLQIHLQKEPRPLVVAGDFNATADEKPFRQVLSLHLADAAVLAGQGWRMTWPRDQSWVIPYLRLDHVLLSPSLTVTEYRLGVGRGSDHHPLIVGVGFRS